MAEKAYIVEAVRTAGGKRDGRVSLWHPADLGAKVLDELATRLDIRRIGSVKEGDEVMGNETRVKVVKNKVSPPFKQAEFQIMYGQGINQEGEILDFGHKLGLVDKSGAFYKLDGESIGQGKVKASSFLKENAKVRDKLVKEIRSSYISSKSK